MSQTKIKICGLSRPCDADFINEAMPDYAGFVFYPKSHRAVTEAQAKALRAKMRPSIPAVGVFVNEVQSRICQLYHAGTIQIIQLHGTESEEYLSALRKALPTAEIWKAFPVRCPDDIEAAKRSSADRVLLDNGLGTGQRFDWSLIDPAVHHMILAGGLTPDNIPDAIEQFCPWAVDISSGVEQGGVKDKEKIIRSVRAARAAKR